jgi:RNA polymerase sigma-70 factor (ECF subfamily)
MAAVSTHTEVDCSAPDDAREFEQAFRDHVDFAWRVLQRHGVQASDLEDTCQEVFLTLHRSLPRFEGRSSLRTFIYAICRRVASNHRRLAVHRHEVATGHAAEPDAARPDLPTPAGDGEAFERLATKRSLALLEMLVARLPPEQREVFVLYEIDELSMREVAEAVGCPQNTCFSRLYAARRELAGQLQRLRAKPRVA